MRTAERSGCLANRSLIWSTYGSSALSRRAAVDNGGCCIWRAAVTVSREQCKRRAMTRPESFSISLRRRISAHKATFMAWPSPARKGRRQRFAGTRRPEASALVLVRRDGPGQAPAATAPEPTATQWRSGRGRAVPAEPPAELAALAADGWSGCGRCRTTSRGGRPRPPETGTTALLHATDNRRVHAGSGDQPRTNPSPADAADAHQPECVFGSCSCLELLWSNNGTDTWCQTSELLWRGERLQTGAAYTLVRVALRVLSWRCWCCLARCGGAGAWPGTLAAGDAGHGKYHVIATCVRARAPGEPPGDRHSSSSGPTSPVAHGSPVGRRWESSKKCLPRDHARPQPRKNLAFVAKMGHADGVPVLPGHAGL